MRKIYVVGIGPGGYENMTIRAAEILKSCDLIAGYQTYIELIQEYFPEKEFLAAPMKQEVERCRLAFEKAGEGKTVAVISSGDAGIYGMAGLMYEVFEEYSGKEGFRDLEIEVVPGITAASSGAALLGAPLVHDFAVISLSDLLTPWEKIEKRLEAAAEADFSIVLYNPSSRKRKDYLERACDILLKRLPEDRICGIADRIGRAGESWEICTLGELRNRQADMFSTIFIGQEGTRRLRGYMVTPRGYRIG